jgi:hypothetical protein
MRKGVTRNHRGRNAMLKALVGVLVPICFASGGASVTGDNYDIFPISRGMKKVYSYTLTFSYSDVFTPSRNEADSGTVEYDVGNFIMLGDTVRAWSIQCTAHTIHRHWGGTSTSPYDSTFSTDDIVIETLYEDMRSQHELKCSLRMHRNTILPWEFVTFLAGDRIYRYWTDSTRLARRANDQSGVNSYFDRTRGLYKHEYTLSGNGMYNVHGHVNALLIETVPGDPVPVDPDPDDPAPVAYELIQNYPNPFNPFTTIRYALPEPSYVILSVFNTLGERVVTLVDNERAAGFHDEIFDASGLSSGVYLYRMQAGLYVETKKMVIVR